MISDSTVTHHYTLFVLTPLLHVTIHCLRVAQEDKLKQARIPTVPRAPLEVILALLASVLAFLVYTPIMCGVRHVAKHARVETQK